MKKVMILLLCFSAYNLGAQDYKADCEKAFSIFQEDVYEVKMEYLFFPSFTTQQHLEKETIHMRRQGNLFHLDQFGIKVVSDDRHVLMIDEESRVVAIDKKAEKTTPNEIDPTAKDALDAALQDLSKAMGWDTLNYNIENSFQVEYAGIKNGNKVYTFNFDYAEYEKLIVHIDADTGKLSKQIIYYREPMEIEEGQFSKVRVEINFLKQTANSVFGQNTFSIGEYVFIQKDGKVQPKGKYKDFILINHLENPTFN